MDGEIGSEVYGEDSEIGGEGYGRIDGKMYGGVNYMIERQCVNDTVGGTDGLLYDPEYSSG